MSKVQNLRPDPQIKRRVLVVDDNLDAVHSMAMLIKAMGHEVQFAINGLAAIDVARRFKPEIILLDLGLPDFKGHEIASSLKFEPGLENTRFVAITGRADEEAKKAALDAGCADFFVKPIAPATLEALLSGGALPGGVPSYRPAAG